MIKSLVFRSTVIHFFFFFLYCCCFCAMALDSETATMTSCPYHHSLSLSLCLSLASILLDFFTLLFFCVVCDSSFSFFVSIEHCPVEWRTQRTSENAVDQIVEDPTIDIDRKICVTFGLLI